MVRSALTLLAIGSSTPPCFLLWSPNADHTGKTATSCKSGGCVHQQLWISRAKTRRLECCLLWSCRKLSSHTEVLKKRSMNNQQGQNEQHLQEKRQGLSHALLPSHGNKYCAAKDNFKLRCWAWYRRHMHLQKDLFTHRAYLNPFIPIFLSKFLICIHPAWIITVSSQVEGSWPDSPLLQNAMWVFFGLAFYRLGLHSLGV